jgi:hypothetical protein
MSSASNYRRYGRAGMRLSSRAGERTCISIWEHWSYLSLGATERGLFRFNWNARLGFLRHQWDGGNP